MMQPNMMEELGIFPMNEAIGLHTFMFIVSYLIQNTLIAGFKYYFYFEGPKTDFIRKLQDQFQNLLKSANTLENVQFHVFEELHMSLTRTVVLRHHWIDEFVRSVEQSLTNAKRFT